MPSFVRHQRFQAFYEENFSLNDLIVVRSSASRFVCLDETSRQRVIIEGDDLKFKRGTPSSGHIETMTLLTAEGDRKEVVSKIGADAGTIGGATINDFVTSFFTLLSHKRSDVRGSTGDDNALAGGFAKDKINGRAGDDLIIAGEGNDILIGGKGSDTFYITSGSGHDRILDFDADGGDGSQDFIQNVFAGEMTVEASGKRDTVIDFANGSSLLLVGVKSTLIDDTDFV